MADVRLEPLGEQHVPDLQAMLGDPLIAEFTPIPQPPAPDQAARMVAAYAEAADREGYAAVDETGTFLGFGMLGGIDLTAAECMLGYMTAPAARGRGVATEVLRLLTERALELGMIRLELRISAGNIASEKVAERNGYQQEGVLRSLHLRGGIRGDATLWSRIS